MLQGHRHNSRKPAGQWRRGPVYVTDARDPSIAADTAPDAADVPGLMHELVDWPNSDDRSHPLVRAAMAHLDLVSIHPWADGNGRMSRSLQTLMIAREGVLAPSSPRSRRGWVGLATPGSTTANSRVEGLSTFRIKMFPAGSASISLPTTNKPKRCRTDSTAPGECGLSCQSSRRPPAAMNGPCPFFITSRWPAAYVVLATSPLRASACSRPSGTCAIS